MVQNKHSQDMSGILQKVARELGSESAWRDKLKRLPGILARLHSPWSVAIGTSLGGWSVFHSEDKFPLPNIEEMLRRHFAILSGQTDTSDAEMLCCVNGFTGLRPSPSNPTSFLTIPLTWIDATLGVLLVEYGAGENCPPEALSFLTIAVSHISAFLDGEATKLRHSESKDIVDRQWIASSPDEERASDRDILTRLPEYIPASVVIADTSENVRLVSRYGRLFVRHPQETVKDMSVERFSQSSGLLKADGVTLPSVDEIPLIRAIRNREIVMDEEWWLRLPGGKRSSVAVSASPIENEQGRVIGAVSIWKDVSADEQQVAAAKARADLIESYASNIVDAVVVFDPGGGVIWINEAARDLVAATPEMSADEWLKSSVWSSLDAESLIPVMSPSSRALQGDTLKDERYRASGDDREIVVSLSASPIRDNEGHVIAAVLVMRDQKDRVALEEWQRQRYQQEHHAAYMLQRMLVPPASYDIQGLDIAARYEPALEEAAVGGDFYDAFDMGGGKVGVLIGDVAGKGLDAAVKVSQARHIVRSYSYLGLSPGQVLRLTNDLLCNDASHEISMLTAFFAVVDVKEGTIAYARAGHEPAILLTRGGALELLEADGCALGVFPGYKYAEGSRKLDPGELVVMITDGITESRTGDDMLGLQGVMECVRDSGSSVPQVVATELLDCARKMSQGKLRDDIAILVFQIERDGN